MPLLIVKIILKLAEENSKNFLFWTFMLPWIFYSKTKSIWSSSLSPKRQLHWTTLVVNKTPGVVTYYFFVVFQGPSGRVEQAGTSFPLTELKHGWYTLCTLVYVFSVPETYIRETSFFPHYLWHILFVYITWFQGYDVYFVFATSLYGEIDVYFVSTVQQCYSRRGCTFSVHNDGYKTTMLLDMETDILSVFRANFPWIIELYVWIFYQKKLLTHKCSKKRVDRKRRPPSKSLINI